MGEMKIKIPDKIEAVFRRLAMQRFGYGKGALSAAAEKAIGEWNDSNGEDEEIVADPIEAIAGMMKHVKKSSVELQHEAWKGIARGHAYRR